MKKLITFFTFIFCCNLCLCAQDIERDSYNNDGTRSIATEGEEFTDDNEMYLSAFKFTSTPEPQYYLNFKLETDGVMDKGNSLLIKFEDESIMELKCIAEQVCHVVNYFWGSRGIEPSFAVSKEQLDTLSTKKIVKLRFVKNDGFRDFKIKGSKLHKLISVGYENIKAALNKKRDIKEGF